MSWIQKLYETYESCQSVIGKVASEREVPLLPICHTTNKAQIEIVIDHQGNFKRARVVPKDDARTIIPCTEKSSGGRTSGEAPHPLSDKLQYVAKDYKDYGGDKKPYFKSYISNLEAWCKSKSSHPKAKAVLNYVNKGTVAKDLIDERILIVGDDGKLLKKWEGDRKAKPSIFALFQNEAWQADAFIRWEVENPNDPCSKTWEDETLWKSWIDYYSGTKKEKSLCYVTGKELFMADLHPAKLRNDGDKAKLISSNDWDGFTFRGRFTDTKKHNTYQTCGVGFEVTQKAHGTLRWLISRQGYRNGDQAIVAWSTSGTEIPDPFADSLAILGEDNLKSDDSDNVSVAQNLAIKLRQKIAGYKADLGDTSSIVVMGLDSATQGRMAITFYRELTGSEFLERLEKWHDTCAWVHDYGYNPETKKRIKFVGAPAPKDIAEAAYGSKVDDKLKKSTVERLLPCIIDRQKIPRDIVDSAVRRACNRAGMEGWEWNKTLSIACALYKKFNEKEGYSMALDPDRKTRDYLYGRLLAIADRLEGHALYKSGEKRDTNAARYMQQFADRPNKTWRQIYLSLSPYMSRLGGAKYYKDMMDEVMCKFDPIEDFTSDRPLSGEFLLGYHCQREALRPKGSSNTNE
ncbi:MAG: type I-C CRISPR-associated protein Cas8c/Csd1, partial [Deltaproteobacteria bacterium]|nr:type I-C CRISPR-associated protein Cas8c/Csd1 [Deltaproteobacteria bacterium]